MGLLDNPLIQSAALPLLSALLLAPVLRRFAGPRAASGAVVLALCAGYVAIQGWPPWLPRTSTQKLPGLVLAALLVGWALDSSGLSRCLSAAFADPTDSVTPRLMLTLSMFGRPRSLRLLERDPSQAKSITDDRE